MTVFLDYLRQNVDGFRVVVDSRAAARIAAPPSSSTLEASGSSGSPALDLSKLSRDPVSATAYVSRGGTIFVISVHGSGRIVYEGVKGAPSALQRRAINVVEDALSIARGEMPSKRKRSDADPESSPSDAASEPAASILSDSDGLSGDPEPAADLEVEL